MCQEYQTDTHIPTSGLIGYVLKTTFYTDFSIEDKFVTSSIQDTYNRAFVEWNNDMEYFTELVMMLNFKILTLLTLGILTLLNRNII